MLHRDHVGSAAHDATARGVHRVDCHGRREAGGGAGAALDGAAALLHHDVERVCRAVAGGAAGLLWLHQLHHVGHDLLLGLLDDVLASGAEHPLHLSDHVREHSVHLLRVKRISELVHREVKAVAARLALDAVVGPEVPRALLEFPVAVVLRHVVGAEAPLGLGFRCCPGLQQCRRLRLGVNGVCGPAVVEASQSRRCVPILFHVTERRVGLRERGRSLANERGVHEAHCGHRDSAAEERLDEWHVAAS
mmetsp:Transcript_45579/g.67187  ORF Transcript_45579/g.67187 Transcript_45579/m.67187 type:complete len:249 (-) Transcript_45579:191-937(-)